MVSFRNTRLASRYAELVGDDGEDLDERKLRGDVGWAWGVVEKTSPPAHLPRDEGPNLHLVGRLAIDIWLHGYLINHLLHWGVSEFGDECLPLAIMKASHAFRRNNSPISGLDIHCVRCVAFGILSSDVERHTKAAGGRVRCSLRSNKSSPTTSRTFSIVKYRDVLPVPLARGQAGGVFGCNTVS